MTSWTDVERSAPQLAALVRRAFVVRKHATMATTASDGAPRISGTEVEFTDDGQVRLGMMAGARRAADLRRDPRVAVHSPTDDPPDDDPTGWLGDAKLTAVAVEGPSPGDGAHAFALDLRTVVLTRIAADAGALEITTWRPDGRLDVVRRG